MYRPFAALLSFVRYGFCLLFFIFLNGTQAQNLVADSSFEYNKEIPTLLSSIAFNGSWSTPTRATTDLFCECGKKLKDVSEAQVPHNPMGTQKANTGKCYAGIFAFSHGDYREYLFTQLTSPLQAGIKYELLMYLSLSDHSRATIDQIGACFLKSKISYSNSEVISGIQPAYARLKEEIGTDTVEWHQVSIEYKAKGGEIFLLIGSFDVNELEATKVKIPKGMRTRINQHTERDAYYYIDDVSLREVIPPPVARFDTIVIPKVDTLRSSEATVIASDSINNPELDKPMILKNVLFETSKAVLLLPSFLELDLVVAQMYNNPYLKVQVNGYTDNLGNETKNQALSEKRAKAVLDYLVSRRIDPVRITHAGYGSQNPIAANDTEEGRKQNRRVELVFSK